MLYNDNIAYTDKLSQDAVKKALRKQIEMKAHGNGDKYVCPACGCKFGRTGSYCKWCGQKIVRVK